MDKTDTIVEASVIENTGKEPYITVFGTFKVIPNIAVPVGKKRTELKDAFVNPKDYEELKTKEAMEIVRFIKALAPMPKSS